MRKGTHFGEYGIEALVGLEPFVIYDSDLDCPDHVERNIWDNTSYNYSHAYFVPSTGDSVWVGGRGETPTISYGDSYSKKMCVGTLFARMNETEKSQFIQNIETIKQLFPWGK
jgi:hypothetical protein